MGLSQECKDCLLNRQKEKVKKVEKRVRENYLEEVKKIIGKAKEEETGPVVTERISLLHEKYFNCKYSFGELKKSYNQIMLQKEKEIRHKIRSAEEPLKQAILYARAGNYIDFGALGSVDDQKLEAILSRAITEELPEDVYQVFVDKLMKAKKVVYCTDNCGEIVLDKLLIEQLQKTNPDCEITVIVRGIEVLNDATIEDANEVGLADLVKVIGNGTGIPGSSLLHMNEESRNAMNKADLIISKGQGNFETLNNCGLEVFYLFLCKCAWFVKRFGLPQFEGAFIRECELNSYSI